MANRVVVGSQTPDFSLDGVDGITKQRIHVNSAELRGKIVVVYFYPKDDTPGCTAEACSFRDAFEDFKRAGATVIGISSDSVESHIAFAQKHRLPYLLLADPDNHLRQAYGVPRSMLGILPGRVTYVIDQQGICRHVFDSQMKTKQHVETALEVIRQLTPAAAAAPVPAPPTDAAPVPAPTATIPNPPPAPE